MKNLLSQRLTKGFTKFDTIKPVYHHLQQKLINSTKVLISRDILDFDIETEEVFNGGLLVKNNIKNMDSVVEILSKFDEIRSFLKLPFESIFIEGEHIGFLIEQHSDGMIEILPYVDTWPNAIPPISFACDPNRIQIGTVFLSELNRNSLTIEQYEIRDYTTKSKIKLFTSEEGAVVEKGIIPLISMMGAYFNRYDEKTKEYLAINCNDPKEVEDTLIRMFIDFVNYNIVMLVPFAIQALLLLNITNKEFVSYKLTKNEATKINLAKCLIPKFEYRILDVRRNIKVFNNYEEVKKFIESKTPPNKDIRAHVVRGHFKKRGDKLFWWKPFIRNLKNKDTVGYVDKSYRINK